jgi:hypothetical protein
MNLQNGGYVVVGNVANGVSDINSELTYPGGVYTIDEQFKATIKIAGQHTEYDGWLYNQIRFSIDSVNKSSSILPNHELEFVGLQTTFESPPEEIEA